MGWTAYHPTRYKKNGIIDRKAECSASWERGGLFRVEKSSMAGGVYYAAVTKIREYKDGEAVDIPEEKQETFAAVTLTGVDNSDCGYEFRIKEMEESMGPAQRRCPESILNLLSPTDDACANEWRKACRTYNRRKKELSNLKAGAQIRMNGSVYRLQPYRGRLKWICSARNTYITSSQALDAGFEVL